MVQISWQQTLMQLEIEVNVSTQFVYSRFTNALEEGTVQKSDLARIEGPSYQTQSQVQEEQCIDGSHSGHTFSWNYYAFMYFCCIVLSGK